MTYMSGKDNVVLQGGDKNVKPVSDFLLKADAGKALSGDLVFVVKPDAATPAPTSAVWEFPFTVELQDAAGNVHDWFNATFADGFTATNTSNLGTASMEDEDAVFVNGVAEGILKGDAEDWLDTETAIATLGEQTILGYTVGEKNLTLTFTT